MEYSSPRKRTKERTFYGVEVDPFPNHNIEFLYEHVPDSVHVIFDHRDVEGSPEPFCYLAISGTIDQRVRIDTKIDYHNLEWDNRLRRFCEENKIEMKGPIGWIKAIEDIHLRSLAEIEQDIRSSLKDLNFEERRELFAHLGLQNVSYVHQ